MSCSSDPSSGESDWDHCDQTLLSNAEQVIREISPQKVSDKKTLCTGKKIQDGKKQPGGQRKSRFLWKTEVESICNYLDEQKETVLSSCKVQVLAKQFWDSENGHRDNISNYSEQREFYMLCEKIMKDYMEIYKSCNKGHSKYQDFQLEWFHNMEKYLQTFSSETAAVIPVFTTYSSDFKTKLISTMHSTISCCCSSHIITYFESLNGNKRESRLHPECFSGTTDEYKLSQMHGSGFKMK